MRYTHPVPLPATLLLPLLLAACDDGAIQPPDATEAVVQAVRHASAGVSMPDGLTHLAERDLGGRAELARVAEGLGVPLVDWAEWRRPDVTGVAIIDSVGFLPGGEVEVLVSAMLTDNTLCGGQFQYRFAPNGRGSYRMLEGLRVLDY